MSDLSDRLLLLVIVGTALGSLIVWWSGFVEAEVVGILDFLLGSFLAVIFLAALVLAWRSAKRTEHDESGSP